MLSKIAKHNSRRQNLSDNASIISSTVSQRALVREMFTLKGIQNEFRMFEVPAKYRMRDRLIIYETQEKYVEMRPTKEIEEIE